MFNVDWSNVAKQIADKLQENNIKSTILKMKADVFVMNIAQGSTNDHAWKKAEETAQYFSEKVGSK